MKVATFTLACVDAELPAIQLDNGTWLFHSYKSVEFAEVTDATNAARWITNNVPPKWKIEFKEKGKKGRPGIYLLLSGFLWVVSQGKSELALKFRDEIYEKILPSIIEKGGDIDPNASSEQLVTLQNEIIAMRREKQKHTLGLLETAIASRDVDFVEYELMLRGTRLSESQRIAIRNGTYLMSHD